MTKEYELELCYFKQGDDRAFWSKPFPEEPAEELLKHSVMLERDAETLRILARYVSDDRIKVLDAQPQSIMIELDERLARRLVNKGILLSECEATDEEEAAPHSHA